MKSNATISNFVLPKISEEELAERSEINFLKTSGLENTYGLSDQDKIEKIAFHFKKIMKIMGLDLKDDSLKDTPNRVAKMYITEVFSGLDPKNKPEVKLFDNNYRYNEMLIEKNISLYSYCEHHFVPIIGKVHIAYFSKGKVIGLSKLNRMVQYFAKRPQVQERLTVQIAEGLQEALQSKDVAVVIDAVHLCVASRGIKDTNSSTITSNYSGIFQVQETKMEFLSALKNI